LDILACPLCGRNLSLSSGTPNDAGKLLTGGLTCEGCGRTYPIETGIPRFIARHQADQSFGLQWNRFRTEQLDSCNGAQLSAKRLHTETGWSPQELRGKLVLDVGCGAGRFLEVMAESGCDLVGVDVSSAIDAAAATVSHQPKVDLVQADIYHLPFKPGVFDACYCIGVAQHTPEPQKALSALPKILKPGGRLAVTVYERKPWTLFNGKYLLRPLTRRLNKRVLLTAIQTLMPALFPLTEVLFRLPKIGRVFGFILPVANYVELKELTLENRYRTAILDTFDRLAPEYDQPLTEQEVRDALAAESMEGIERLNNPGVNIVARRQRLSQVEDLSQ
jgi:ubiquinone/menaquinone biosynthesis C-methylase UbiE/uncharacterized protein YbaR (Trm112 family)